MAGKSVQKKLTRVRPPQVQSSYELQVGDAIELQGLPSILGLMGDCTGQSAEPLSRLRERCFVDVNPENFDDVLESMKSYLAFSADSKLPGDPKVSDLVPNGDIHSSEDSEPD